MSQYDLEDLTPHGLVARYVVECRNQGHFLPYSDHAVIDDWLEMDQDPDKILVVLSELLPNYFKDKSDQHTAKPLSGIRRKVLKLLSESRSRGE